MLRNILSDVISLLMQVPKSGLAALYLKTKHINSREDRNGSPVFQSLMMELCKLKSTERKFVNAIDTFSCRIYNQVRTYVWNAI